jgi:salicylate 5-hydroxylase large subunit
MSSSRPIADGWPRQGTVRAPYWIYSDPDLYEREIERIFEGPTWSFVGLAAEVPEAGDFKTTWVGPRSVVLTRARDGSLHVLENRCAHRGVQLCHQPFGRATTITCPYHQWSYDPTGRLLGMPFRKGVAGRGGMPDDFDPTEHGLRALRVHERNGVVFASWADSVESFEEYLGTDMLGWFDRVFDGRELRLLGDLHQRIPANWKLMFENIKDPYHASVLHVFLVTFGLFRADNPSETRMDPTGRHSVLVNARRPPTAEGRRMGSYQEDLELADPRLLDVVAEFPGDATLVMQTIWPNLIVQQQSNTLAVRQIVPRGVGAFDLHWTFFGYSTDDDEMTERRLLQANLMGPSGYVSLDDGEILDLAQRGAASSPGTTSVLEMGGDGIDGEDHAVTEAAIRAFLGHYRAVMDL